MDQLTDGRIPAYMLPMLGGNLDDANALVDVGLWDKADDGGWEFHDWSDYQPDAASVKAKREAESTAGALGNHRRWHARKGITVPDCEFCTTPASGTRSGTRSGEDRVTRIAPESSRPVPDPIQSSSNSVVGAAAPVAAAAAPTTTRKPAASKGTRIPEPFTVTPEMVAWVQAECPGIDGRRATAAFIDYWRAKPGQNGVKVDWPATWRNWMRREATSGQPAKAAAPSNADQFMGRW
ncbi:hypothetical protein [Xylanimonas cellulosilytica]|nr:hypothetical protein [Xylanimonas cellulosilytica]